MKIIKLIIFDFSAVCFSEEEPPFIKQFAKKKKIDFEKFSNAYYKLI